MPKLRCRNLFCFFCTRRSGQTPPSCVASVRASPTVCRGRLPSGLCHFYSDVVINDFA